MSVDLAPTVVASWDKLAGESSVCVCVWLLVASVYLQTMSSACCQQVLMWLFTPSRHKNRQEFVAPIVLMSIVLCGHVGQQLHLSVAADYLLIPPAGLSADRQEKNQKRESALHSLLDSFYNWQTVQLVDVLSPVIDRVYIPATSPALSSVATSRKKLHRLWDLNSQPTVVANVAPLDPPPHW